MTQQDASLLFSAENSFTDWDIHLPHSGRVLLLPKTDSTSLQARKRLTENFSVFPEDKTPGKSSEEREKHGHKSPPSILIADAQSAGTGRFQREWRSPAACNLYFTLILRPECDMQLWAGVTQVAALTLANLLQECGISVQVKWPNDLLWNKHKICGMLAETVKDSQNQMNLLLGIGLNVNTPRESFVGLDRLATSLREIHGKSWNREALLQLFLDHFFDQLILYENEGLSPFLTQWKSMDNFLHTKAVRVSAEQETEGYIRDINPDGSLLFELPDGTLEKVYSGDLEVPGARLQK
jgi:BirA family biotin operon repressor/biotin-[acetyl-CoA-carboxylase] ligase